MYIRWTSLTGSSTAGGPTMVFDRRQRLALTAHDASCLPDDAVPIAEPASATSHGFGSSGAGVPQGILFRDGVPSSGIG